MYNLNSFFNLFVINNLCSGEIKHHEGNWYVFLGKIGYGRHRMSEFIHFVCSLFDGRGLIVVLGLL